MASVEEIKAQGWSLNPGRYVGVAEGLEEGPAFDDRLQELNEELELLTKEAHKHEQRITHNVKLLLEADIE